MIKWYICFGFFIHTTLPAGINLSVVVSSPPEVGASFLILVISGDWSAVLLQPSRALVATARVALPVTSKSFCLDVFGSLSAASHRRRPSGVLVSPRSLRVGRGGRGLFPIATIVFILLFLCLESWYNTLVRYQLSLIWFLVMVLLFCLILFSLIIWQFGSAWFFPGGGQCHVANIQ